jgi:NAD(P)-dependent dehydrogenase (short-subunit alcohol dehydrogenase family)
MTKTDSVWFVTGASKGLGLCLVQKLLEANYRVAATSRSLAELQRVLGAKSDRFLPLEVDLRDPAAVASAVNAAKERFGALDVVVNNAGYGQLGTIEEATDEEARRCFDVNVFGTLNVLRATVGHLREQRAGHVFNISSIGGFFGGFSGWGIYCSTKFAVAGLTESLHEDLAPFGVHVTLVYPGYFRTSFLGKESLVLPAHPLPAYEGARASEARHVEVIAGQQAGDPDKLADVLIQTYRLESPPLHLFVGRDAVAMAEAKQEQVHSAIDRHRALSVSTDYASA